MNENIKKSLKKYIKLHSKFYQLSDSSLGSNSLEEYKEYHEIHKELERKFSTSFFPKGELLEIVEYCIEKSSKNTDKKTEKVIGKLEEFVKELKN